MKLKNKKFGEKIAIVDLIVVWEPSFLWFLKFVGSLSCLGPIFCAWLGPHFLGLEKNIGSLENPARGKIQYFKYFIF